MKQIMVLFLIAYTGLFSQTIIKMEDGKVEGYLKKEIHVFKGIPFAAPPVGELRWKSPQPVKPWKGIKKCLEFSPSPIQNDPKPFYAWSEEFIAKPESLSEDCLYLNVWTPTTSKKAKLPVFVWIYGGGLSSGSANCDIYDGEELARQGVVFVSLNYRVGVLGFLAHPALSAESGHTSGNYGFMDQLQALRWLQKNISDFGGDPENITIAGQSAGSFSVNVLIASPQAKGFFHKAIAQSGGLLSSRFMQTLSDAEKQGEEFMKVAGARDLSELRQLPAEKLLEFSNQPGVGRFGVVTDGHFLPTDIQGHFEKGDHNPVPVITGWVSGDGSFLNTGGTTATEFKKSAAANYSDRQEEFLELFPANTDLEAKASQEKLTLLGFAGIPAYRLAKHMSNHVWLYEFTHVPTDKPGFPNYGAFHTSEVPFALHTLDQWKRPWKPEERILEDQMSGYWVNFAKTGNPNGKGLPEWKAYDPELGEILIIDTEIMGMELKYQKEFRFLAK